MYFCGICTEYCPQRNVRGRGWGRGWGGGRVRRAQARSCLTPSLSQPVKFPGWKVHTYTIPSSVFVHPITNLLSILCILIEVHSHAPAKGAKKPLWFEIWHFNGCFPSDGMARMAVKGLNDFFILSVSLSVPHLHEVIVGHMWPVLTSWVLTRRQLTVVQAKAASGGHWSHCGA